MPARSHPYIAPAGVTVGGQCLIDGIILQPRTHQRLWKRSSFGHSGENGYEGSAPTHASVASPCYKFALTALRSLPGSHPYGRYSTPCKKVYGRKRTA